MGPHIRIHASQNRSGNKGNYRTLLRSSDPPKSPLVKGNPCEALAEDGTACDAVLSSEGHTWCNRHFVEMKDLKARWKRREEEAININATDPDTAKQKVIKLRLAVELRRQIRERFYPHGGDTADYIQWITKLEKDMRSLADSILMSNMARRETPDTPAIEPPEKSERIFVLRSPLDPKIPMNTLQEMPDDGTILVLKHFYTDLCADAVRRLYKIAPDLNDATPRTSPPKKASPHDGGTDILRAWFRIMIFNSSEAEALEHATKSSSIDDFLNGCHASQVETYCDFFENAWRPHAVQCLRVAICAQTLAGSEIKTIGLLGGTIPSTSEGLKMTKPCWDILYRWFPTLLTPWTLASICQNFQDYTSICKLLMLGLYSKHWFDPDSILLDCTAGVYLGFIPTSKGDFTSLTGTEQIGDVVEQVQARNYVTGQMAIGDPLTETFLDEIRRRTERLLLVVYEGTNADATVYPSDDDMFVRRRRSAKIQKNIEDVPWTTELTLEDIKNDLRLRKTSTSMYDPIVVDSWQFIIIDKHAGEPFTLFDVIQDALLMLEGDPSPRQIAKRVIREVIPSSVQEFFLEEMQLDSSAELSFPPPPEVQYEGNRQRCWDADRQLVLAAEARLSSHHGPANHTPARPTRDTNRFIRHVIDDMERNGIISLAAEYEVPQTRPVVLQSTDGLLDLYFPYSFGGLAPDSELTPSLTLPPASCILSFAQAFKKKHPKALMAKGTIQTHYCAWPMPSIKRLGKSRLNFATWEGHIYHWNAMPFDRPWSERAWQFYLNHYVNEGVGKGGKVGGSPSSVRSGDSGSDPLERFWYFYLTTFVICAVDEGDVERVVSELGEEMEDRGWRVVVPPIGEWKANVEELGLGEGVLFGGLRPMG